MNKLSKREDNQPEADNNSIKPVNVAESWECVSEELQNAQIAERQKQLAQRQNEEEQLKLSASTSIVEDNKSAQTPCFDPLGGRPIRLLRRPESSSKLQDNSDNQKNAKLLTLEEREAAYLQVRKRIFGNDSSIPPDEPIDAASVQRRLAEQINELCLKTPVSSDNLKKKDGDESSTTIKEEPLRNYLSDVEMVTSTSTHFSSRKAGPSSKLPQQRPPSFGIVPPPYAFPSHLPPSTLWTPPPPHCTQPLQSIPYSGAPTQYGQPPGFAAGFLPPQSVYQGSWFVTQPPLPPPLRQQMPLNFTPGSYPVNMQSTNTFNTKNNSERKDGFNHSGWQTSKTNKSSK